MPLVATRGAASAQGFGEFAQSAPPVYIEDVFNTWLYTGTGSALTITNGIDLAGKGGLVWTKARSAANRHALVDTVQGGGFELASNLANGANAVAPATTFGAAGYTMNDSATSFNQNGTTYASWTFREQPKFFDVVTYTGTGSARTIAHNLGSAPGCMIIKQLNTTRDWYVYHRSLGVGSNSEILLNFASAASGNGTATWNNTAPTDTVFSLGSGSGVNQSGGTYVAYLFAHNAGGFGLTGTDNVISCGSYTGSATDWAAGASLGYEPQWVLIKNITSGTANWNIFDNMRGMFVSSADDPVLFPNLSNAEEAYNLIRPTATGFEVSNSSRVGGAGNTCIYIAIRRGPMKVPTTGTSVYSPVTYTGDGAASRAVTTGFVSDVVWTKSRSNATEWMSSTLLAGTQRILIQNTTDAEVNVSGGFITAYNNTGFTFGTAEPRYNTNARTYVVEGFSRAPSFMDVVCYSGTGANRTVTHNLAAVPELMIVKGRSASGSWVVYSAPRGPTEFMTLNSNSASGSDSGIYWNSTAPTASVFSLSTGGLVNTSNATYVNYLFTSCPGVSRVGSYTGTGATQVINCGFTGGSRFVLIKATSTTGDWYVWDSARGIVAGNDPYLLLNSTAAEVTNTDWVDTAATGFELSNAGGNLVNSNGVSYIFLAIA